MWTLSPGRGEALERADAVRVLRVDDNEALHLLRCNVAELPEFGGIEEFTNSLTFLSIEPGMTMTPSG